jgi:hypothetical protein
MTTIDRPLAAAAAVGALALFGFAAGCGGPAPAGTAAATETAATPPPVNASGCQATLPEIPTGNRPPGLEVMLVDPTPAQWGVVRPEGDPLPLDSTAGVQPLHVRVAHRLDPQLKINQAVDAQIYLIFPRNELTVKPPKTGWQELPATDAYRVYCGEVHGRQTLARRGPDEVFWITPAMARPYSVQWQLAGTAEVGPLSTRLRGFTFEVTP